MAEQLVPGWLLRPEQPILHGAMGTVYFVCAVGDPTRRVVVKCPKAEFLRHANRDEQEQILARFVAERAFAAACRVPEAIRVLDDGEATFPDFPERPLPYALLEELVPPDPSTFTRTQAIQLLVGTLQAMHRLAAIEQQDGAIVRRGILHRDIKTDNVWLQPDGRVVFLDFGLACWIEDSSGASSLGERVGTPEMMAPEMLQGGRRISANADLFSVAAMLVGLLTGQAPFPGRRVDDVLASMRTTRIEHIAARLRSAPLLQGWDDADAFIAVLCGMLEKEPGLRTRCAWDALTALADIPSVRAACNPFAFLTNPRAFEARTLREQLILLAGAAPTALLLAFLEACQRTMADLSDFLLRAWLAGKLATSATTIVVDWRALLASPEPLLALGGSFYPIASFVGKIDVQPGGAIPPIPDVPPQDLAEFLDAYVAVRALPLDAHPALRTLLATTHERAGSLARAAELLNSSTDPSDLPLQCSLALRLGRVDEAAAFLEHLPSSGERTLYTADLALMRQDAQGVLIATREDAIPRDTPPQLRAAVYARRLRVTRFLIRALTGKGKPAELELYKSDVARMCDVLHELALPPEQLPPATHLSLGLLAADAGDEKTMRRHFDAAVLRLPAQDHASHYQIAEAEYLCAKRLWDEHPQQRGSITPKLIAAAMAALERAEALGDPGRLKNALVNCNEALANDLADRLAPSLRVDDPQLAATVARFTETRDRIKANELRIELLLSGADDAHYLTRKLAPWTADLAVLLTDLVWLDRWYEDARTRTDFTPSAEGYALVAQRRLALLGALTQPAHAQVASATTGELFLQMLQQVRRASTIDGALRAVLDWAILHFGARYGLIYFAAHLGESAPPPYRFGRRLEGGDTIDIPDEPHVSRTLKHLFLNATGGDIINSRSQEVAGTESVALMGAEIFLGVALGRRGILLLVVDETKDRAFGDHDKMLLAELAAEITRELTAYEVQQTLRGETARLQRDVAELHDKLHAAKNRFTAPLPRLRTLAEFHDRVTTLPLDELEDYVPRDALDETEYILRLNAEYHTHIDGIREELQGFARITSEDLNASKQVSRSVGYVSVDTGRWARYESSVSVVYEQSYVRDSAPDDIHALFTDLLAAIPLEDEEKQRCIKLRGTAPPYVRFHRGSIISMVDNLRTNLQDPALFAERGPMRLHLHTVVHGPWVDVSVSDNGIGMDQPLLDRVVESFTTKPVGEGSGVGIPSMISTMNRHLGTLAILSRVQVGTIIRFRFPHADRF